MRHAWNRCPRPLALVHLAFFNLRLLLKQLRLQLFNKIETEAIFKKYLVKQLQLLRYTVAVEAAVICLSRIGKAILLLIHSPHNETILKMTL